MKNSSMPAAPERGAGYYTALVRQHDWPPGFEPAMPQLAAGVRLGRPSAQCRANGGFDGAPLNLPGAMPYIAVWKADKGAC